MWFVYAFTMYSLAHPLSPSHHFPLPGNAAAVTMAVVAFTSHRIYCHFLLASYSHSFKGLIHSIFCLYWSQYSLCSHGSRQLNVTMWDCVNYIILYKTFRCMQTMHACMCVCLKSCWAHILAHHKPNAKHFYIYDIFLGWKQQQQLEDEGRKNAHFYRMLLI